eukprot:gnl/TRDRNA2_/TRDRNA2_177995_c0_seq1.p1 gnl/TRDRNA2_/TRDRNA2_177995_c0~~gnl/TRDRNA2_/TRDRNA2_177995_c0_seq1.p1  ORF type:complete len:281 (-),score=-4.80 gnl/TRDRNA2_/TRDRNA2_177995_c0_seq1:1324-2166(-)
MRIKVNNKTRILNDFKKYPNEQLRKKKTIMAIEKAKTQNHFSLGLTKLQLQELYDVCLKMASENKITLKNTWNLNLLDYINDLIKSVDYEKNQINFSKASYALDAGVKIYCSRVDSIHFETFKLLGSILRNRNISSLGTSGQDEVKINKKILNEKRSLILNKYKSHSMKIRPKRTLAKPATITTKINYPENAVNLLFFRNDSYTKGCKRRSCNFFLNYFSVFSGCTLLVDTKDVPIPQNPCFEKVENFFVDLNDVVNYKVYFHRNLTKIEENKQVMFFLS